MAGEAGQASPLSCCVVRPSGGGIGLMQKADDLLRRNEQLEFTVRTRPWQTSHPDRLLGLERT